MLPLLLPLLGARSSRRRSTWPETLERADRFPSVHHRSTGLFGFLDVGEVRGGCVGAVVVTS